MLRALRAQAQALCEPARHCALAQPFLFRVLELPVLVPLPDVPAQVAPLALALRRVGHGSADSAQSARFAQPEPDEPELPQQSVCQRQ